MDIKESEYLPLRDVVFLTLRKAILRGELAPGERLMELQLSERLGVSRTPIREAMRKLELEGLVVMVPRKGAEVAKISERSLKEVLEVRRALEELAVELACERMTEEEFKKLKKACIAFEHVSNSNDLIDVAQKDEEFHDVIYKATNNSKLILLINNLREQMYRYRLEYIKDKEKRQELVEEHKHIVNVLSQKNVEEAKIAVKEHIDNQEMTVTKNLKEHDLL